MRHKEILDGLTLFQRSVYPRHRELFQHLATNQQPRAVFITCSDSRVVPNLILQAEPGDLFIIRTVGNIVPPIDAGGGVAASIEHAVQVLGISDVIVCGHSNCGAMQAVLHPERLGDLPNLAAWVRHAEPARAAAIREHPSADEETLLDLTVEYNVLVQLRNLLTYPFIRAGVEKGAFGLYGWVYDIATGVVRGPDASGTRFVPVGRESAGAVDRERALTSLEEDEAFWERL
jgi:carbonic anhydrase